MVKPVSIKSCKPCVCPVDLQMCRTDGSESPDNFRCTSYYQNWSNMFIRVGKSDVRTDGQSVRAETAAVNMKGDTQAVRTVRSVRHKKPSQHKTKPMCLQAATFGPSKSNSSPNVLTMTPWMYIKVMEVRLRSFYIWKLNEVITNCLKPPHVTAV
jgi:hypothetical protein